jgi:hypothetical protein
MITSMFQGLANEPAILNGFDVCDAKVNDIKAPLSFGGEKLPL